MRLYGITFCKNFAANFVSLCQLHKMNYWWDNRLDFNHIRKANWSYTTITILEEIHGQNVLKYTTDDIIKAAFYSRRNYFNS